MAAEIIRPDADTSIGSWTDDGGGTTNIYQSIDEASASDTDYIKTENNPSASACTIGIANPGTAPVSLHGRISYRYRKQGGRTADLTVNLKVSGNTVQTWSHAALGTSWVQADQLIVAEITDWDALTVEFIGNQSSGGSTTTVEISWLELTTSEVKTIKGTGGDYSSIYSGWEANLDNTTYTVANTVAEGHVYSDTAFDESGTISTAASNIMGVVLTVPSAERHDGTAGSGARVVRTAGGGAFAIMNTLDMSDLLVNWLELDVNGQTYRFALFQNAGSVIRSQGLLAHDQVSTTNGDSAYVLFAVRATSGEPANGFTNCIVYDHAGSGSGGVFGISVDSNATTQPAFALNCTVHNIVTTHSTANATCIQCGDTTGSTVRNCIATDPSVSGGSGTAACFSPSSPTNAVMSHNLSSDTTASGTGSLTSKTSANQFTSTTGGSEDLHLKAGADAIDAGTDLVVSPAGVNLDIDGYDRDTNGVTWDMGADERVVVVTASPTHAIMRGAHLGIRLGVAG